MHAEDLLAALRNASRSPAHRGALHAVLGEAASSSSSWLVEHLFEQQQLVPVRRPHPEDEVVANLDRYSGASLSADYLQAWHTIPACYAATLCYGMLLRYAMLCYAACRTSTTFAACLRTGCCLRTAAQRRIP